MYWKVGSKINSRFKNPSIEKFDSRDNPELSQPHINMSISPFPSPGVPCDIVVRELDCRGDKGLPVQILPDAPLEISGGGILSTALKRASPILSFKKCTA